MRTRRMITTVVTATLLAAGLGTGSANAGAANYPPPTQLDACGADHDTVTIPDYGNDNAKFGWEVNGSMFEPGVESTQGASSLTVKRINYDIRAYDGEWTFTYDTSTCTIDEKPIRLSVWSGRCIKDESRFPVRVDVTNPADTGFVLPYVGISAGRIPDGEGTFVDFVARDIADGETRGVKIGNGVNRAGLPAGRYNIEVRDDDGRIIATTRFRTKRDHCGYESAPDAGPQRSGRPTGKVVVLRRDVVKLVLDARRVTRGTTRFSIRRAVGGRVCDRGELNVDAGATRAVRLSLDPRRSNVVTIKARGRVLARKVVPPHR